MLEQFVCISMRGRWHFDVAVTVSLFTFYTVYVKAFVHNKYMMLQRGGQPESCHQGVLYLRGATWTLAVKVVVFLWCF